MSAPDGRPFPFFDLPRELRDAVYQEVIERRPLKPPSSHTKNQSGLTLHITAPETALLLTNRQFKTEYREQLSNSTQIRLIENWEFAPWCHSDMLELEPFAGDIRYAELWLYAKDRCCSTGKSPGAQSSGAGEAWQENCSAAHVIRRHIDWLHVKLSRWTALRSISIKLFVRWSPYRKETDYKWPKAPHGSDLHFALDEMTAMHERNIKMDQLEVYQYTGYTYRDFKQGPYVTWDEKGGWRAVEAGRKQKAALGELRTART